MEMLGRRKTCTQELLLNFKNNSASNRGMFSENYCNAGNNLCNPLNIKKYSCGELILLAILTKRFSVFNWMSIPIYKCIAAARWLHYKSFLLT